MKYTKDVIEVKYLELEPDFKSGIYDPNPRLKRKHESTMVLLSSPDPTNKYKSEKSITEKELEQIQDLTDGANPRKREFWEACENYFIDNDEKIKSTSRVLCLPIYVCYDSGVLSVNHFSRHVGVNEIKQDLISFSNGFSPIMILSEGSQPLGKNLATYQCQVGFIYRKIYKNKSTTRKMLSEEVTTLSMHIKGDMYRYAILDESINVDFSKGDGPLDDIYTDIYRDKVGYTVVDVPAYTQDSAEDIIIGYLKL